MDPLKAAYIQQSPTVPAKAAPGRTVETEQPLPEERFVSSDMAQMLDDIARVDPTYLKKTPVESPEAQKDQKEPFMSPDMAQMVEDIKRYEESVDKGPGGTTLLLSSGKVPVTLAQLDAPSVEHGHGRDQESKTHHHLSHLFTAAHLGIEGAETGGLLVQAAETTSHGASETAAHAVHEATGEASHISEAGATMGHAVSGALVAGAIGSGIVAAGMTALGVRNIRKGIKRQDKEKILEGSGETILGAKSAASALSLAGHGAGEGILATVAHGAHTLLMPLGLAHGAIDVTLGIKKVYDGIKHHKKGEILEGLLEVGQGTSIGAAAVVGGLPAILVASAFLGGKVLVHHISSKKTTHHSAE
jgi:hypothetical protein